jgi:hypothetical protein
MERADANCILCNSPQRSLLCRQGDWTVYRCNACGLGFLYPRPDPDELSELYRSGYFQSHYDAGRVLNMMNGREDKSQGMRMYTLRKTREPGFGVGPGTVLS